MMDETEPAQLFPIREGQVVWPAIILRSSGRTQETFFEFFAAEITNRNTRESYLRDVTRFSQWCVERGFAVDQVSTLHLAAYREVLRKELSPPSVKRHFSALRRLFAWWVEKGVLERNPVREVRTEKFSRSEGKTPAFDHEDMQVLFASFDPTLLIDLRDRALIGVMAFSFARVEAVCKLKMKDYYAQGRRSYLQLNEKGGMQRDIPCNHRLEEFLDSYVVALGESANDAPLFRSARGRTGLLESKKMQRTDVYAMVQRRVSRCGIVGKFSCHSFRATGITNFLENGGSLEKAQWIAGHADSRTTKLYDRRALRASIEDLERVRF